MKVHEKKQSNIDRRARDKKAAVVGVAIYALIMALSAAAVGWVCFLPETPAFGELLMGVLAVVLLLMIVPAFVALKQRFEEIEGGELDEAAEY